MLCDLRLCDLLLWLLLWLHWQGRGSREGEAWSGGGRSGGSDTVEDLSFRDPAEGGVGQLVSSGCGEATHTSYCHCIKPQLNGMCGQCLAAQLAVTDAQHALYCTRPALGARW